MNRKQAIEKLNKIRALAENGVGGEKDAAAAALERIMKEYGITDDSLEVEEEILLFSKVNGMKSWDLFKQIAAVRYGVRKMAYIGRDCRTAYAKSLREKLGHSKPKWANVLLFCSPGTLVQINYAYELYQRSLNDHAEAMFYAFLEKNNLLAPPDPDNKNASMTDDQARIAWRMGMAVTPTTVNKALTE